MIDADGSGCVWRRFEDLCVAYTVILIYVCILFVNGLCNPAKTLYSKIMYKYAQFNEMRTFSYLKDGNKVNCAHF